MNNTLRITEIFYSLQGESNKVGLPTVFVRLTGCPLRCGYCDTPYAFKGGEVMSFDEIFAEIARYQTSHVTITGGEPLAQKNCFPLMEALCDAHYKVSLETSGALPIEKVDPRVMKVMDLKTPDSNECHRNLLENLQFLTSQDQIKLVICSEADYQWAKNIVEKENLPALCEVLFSPCYETLSPAILARWILKDQLKVRFQIQLHKMLELA